MKPLELAAVLQVRGDTGSAEAVARNLGRDSGSGCAALDDHVGIGLGERQSAGQLAVLHGREQGRGRLR
jgi:hypothetical protein